VHVDRQAEERKWHVSEQALDGVLVDVLPDAVLRELGQRLGIEDLRQVHAPSAALRSSNAWLCGQRPEVVFVKLYARPAHAATEHSVAAALSGRHTVMLLDGDHLPAVGHYNVFRFEQMVRAPWTAGAAAEAGTLLARVHAAEHPDGLRHRVASEAAFDDLLTRFAAAAPDVYSEHRAELLGAATRSLVRAAEQVGAESPDVLLHGDFSLRNVGVRPDGQYVVFDFERAALGPAEFDLERIWDRELAAIEHGRQRFVDSYAGTASGRRPNPDLLRYARLTCALTTVMGGRRTRDQPFENEGRTMLEALC
jgi:hypothetical protein